jgi:hypothetical protein
MWVKWVLLGMLTLGGGWMTYDGARALIVGDYTTPSTGKYAGQLGPWAPLVERVGISARSTFMKLSFVALGLSALTAAALFGFGVAGAKIVGASFALFSLWYLPVGTVFSVLEIALLAAFWKTLP